MLLDHATTSAVDRARRHTKQTPRSPELLPTTPASSAFLMPNSSSRSCAESFAEHLRPPYFMPRAYGRWTSQPAPRRLFPSMAPWVAPLPTPGAPAGGRTLIALYAALELGACTGLLVLCTVVAWHERLRQNAVLLNFVAVFALTAAGTSAMAWTGHASDAAPPRGLCLTTAGFAASLAAAKAGAAFSLTCKVCG
jgi:hypothetical protein